MGVHGLWRLIEPSGKPVPLETLENKVLAVDVSIWLHQAVKGFQDSRGGSVPNAHLLGIYHRVCKLLYFKIKPVFVFDGGVPALKKQTIAKRTQSKLRNLSAADKIQRQLLDTLLKHTAVSKVLSEKIEASIGSIPKPLTKKPKEDLYILPHSSELDSTISSSDEESYIESSTSDSSPTKSWDLHTIDMESTHFKSLPVDVRHEILTDLKETRKQSSWGRLHELPKVSDDFSVYQMQRLLKRQAVQTALEDAEKEMGGKSLSMAELESILKDQGVIAEHAGKRIASDETTKYLLVKDVKKAIEIAKQKEKESQNINEQVESPEPSTNTTSAEAADSSSAPKSKADVEYEEDLQKAIAMSLECEPSTSNGSNKVDEPQVLPKKLNPAEFSFLDNFTDADFVSSSSSEEEEEMIKPSQVAAAKLATAQSYMLEYSGLTPSEISKIIGKSAAKPIKPESKKSPKLSAVPESCEVVSSTSVTLPEEDAVELMSGSDSESDSAVAADSKVVVIDPNQEFNEEDDLFADVFTSESETVDSSVQSLDRSDSSGFPASLSTVSFECKSLEEVVKPTSEKEPEKVESTDSEQLILPSSSTINSAPIEPTTIKTSAKKPSLTEQELKTLKDQLQKDQVELITERSTKERMAENITDQMYQEAQELLELFGVPYLVAPMEAEAQCAFLDAIDLTDGTITDDSDIWLFGGRTVYKNFFNQSKYVMEFKAENVKHHFKLTREQMILFSLLVGSDYTIGLQGVGPVTAMEILAAFPPGKAGKIKEFSLSHAELLSGLQEFRSWFTKGKSAGPGRSSLKSKLKNVVFTENFPSLQVVDAYLNPTVETSRDAFSWTAPNAPALVGFARDKFGWTKLKTEEILNPVLKKLQESSHQKSIRDYFKTRFTVHSSEAEKKMSKRVKTAITNMGRDPSEVLIEELREDLKKQPRKKRPKKMSNGTETSEFTQKSVSTESKIAEPKNRKEKLHKLKTQDNKSETPDPNIQLTTDDVTNMEDLKKQPKRRLKKAPNETEAPEFPQKSGSAESEAAEPKNRKVKLHKLKTPDDKSETTDSNNQRTTADVAAKIEAIRRRRKLKDAKVGVDLKKPKLIKEVVGAVPSELRHDDEVNLLSEVVSRSNEKVEKINREMEEQLKNIQLVNSTQPSTSSARPINRPTRVPRKETIPQKARDQTTLLRNKLKAIEVFRKGKQGPGYVPKRERKRRMPKKDADLSESSDE